MRKKILGYRSEVAVRCCDIGGWLDTWFAEYGDVVNLGVMSRFFGKAGPFRGIEVLVGYNKPSVDLGIINICAADPTYDVIITVRDLLENNFDHQNLLLAVLYLVEKECFIYQDIEIRIMNLIPPGASLGTSAAVAVSLIKAIYNHPISDEQAAMLALKAEREVMKGQSGTQDQFAAAFSHGVNYIHISDYPQTTCQPIYISHKTKRNLENGLITIFYGQHNSSEMHLRVIKKLEQEGPKALRLEAIRPLPKQAEKYLRSDDLVGFGQVMKENTEAQRRLCDGLVCAQADSIIELAAKNALGWKVNGAGGLGGSLTILFPSRSQTEEFYQKCQRNYPKEAGLVYFEHQLASG